MSEVPLYRRHINNDLIALIPSLLFSKISVHSKSKPETESGFKSNVSDTGYESGCETTGVRRATPQVQVRA